MPRNATTTIAVAVLLGVVTTTGAQDLRRETTQMVSITGIYNETYDTHSFHVESVRSLVESSPRSDGRSLSETDSREIEALFINGAVPFEIKVYDGNTTSRGSGVSISHPETGWPTLVLNDENADGQMDILSYSVLDEAGEVVVELTDYNADGQWDIRTHSQDNYFEIWQTGRWYRVETRNGQRGILINGRFVVLERQNNRWIVP